MNADDAYWNQEEHPDLVVTACCTCKCLHLNRPLIVAICPDCAIGDTDGN